MRASGVLLPVFSLPGKYGTGCFSEEAKRFTDKLAAAGQKYWQILPLAHAGGWYSPYQPLSCFAIDPAFIDPDTLIRKGLITDDDASDLVHTAAEQPSDRIDHGALLPIRMKLLRRAFGNFCTGSESSDFRNLHDRFKEFCSSNAYWLDDYALFIALTRYHHTPDWSRWEPEYKVRDPKALKEFADDENIGFYKWLQFEAYSEWQDVCSYAHEKNVEIIGDIPIYAAFESADCWAHPELFKLKKNLKPEAVAGCPPDAFSPTGQIWGNPLYKWSYHKQTGYKWWLERLAQNFEMYDVIRLDHMRGFESFFSVPSNAETALEGHWMRGPGMDFFDHVSSALPNGKFIAEDLGYITPAVQKLIEQTGLPGMKVLQFAFDTDPNNIYLPDHYPKNCVVYTGTHDNDTTVGWYMHLDKEIRRFVTNFIRSQSGGRPEESAKAPEFGAKTAARSLVQIALRSVADTCIIPLQDHLLLGSSARVNTPGTTGDNWNWRMDDDMFTDEVAAYILMLTKESGRLQNGIL